MRCFGTPSTLPPAHCAAQLTGHGLMGRVMTDAGPMASANKPGAPATPLLTNLTRQVPVASLAWVDVLDDGGDDVFRYDLEWAMLDLVDPSAPKQWLSAYSGIEKRTCQLANLQPDADYCVRVAATNSVGQGEWSAPLQFTTPKLEEAKLRVAELPPQWRALEVGLMDMLDVLNTGVPTSTHWGKLVKMLRTHQVHLKIAYRLYSLLGSGSGSSDGMDLTQFRFFVDECEIRTPKGNAGGTKISSAVVDLIFQRANRDLGSSSRSGTAVNTGTTRPGQNPVATPMRLIEGEEILRSLPGAEGNSEFKLLQFEFVHAVLRLAKTRFGPDLPREDPAPLATSLDLLMERCVKANLRLSVSDEITEAMQSRRLRAVLARHYGTLSRAFMLYCGVDESDGVELSERTAKRSKRGADHGKGKSTNGEGGKQTPQAEAAPSKSNDPGRLTTLNLSELLTMLKEARLLDDSCSPRAVTTFFVKVNLDDELYEREDGQQLDHTQLEYDEFLEVLVRVCNAKVPPDGRDEPFEETLDTWLTLYGVPALANATKHRAEMRGAEQ